MLIPYNRFLVVRLQNCIISIINVITLLNIYLKHISDLYKELLILNNQGHHHYEFEYFKDKVNPPLT